MAPYPLSTFTPRKVSVLPLEACLLLVGTERRACGGEVGGSADGVQGQQAARRRGEGPPVPRLHHFRPLDGATYYSWNSFGQTH